MTALVAIVPSRGRPEAAREMVTAFQSTCEAATRLVFAVDSDDPMLPAYEALTERESEVEVFTCPAPSTMVKALNAAALHYAPTTFALAFLGDDHRPRTRGWDRAYFNALHAMHTGIVYGDDLLQHEAIPTQVAMTSNIVQALGHMAPQQLRHLFVDNYWRDLGNAAGCLRYLPDVIVEHMHPFAGKAQMDEGYHRVNATTMYNADGAAYAMYTTGGQMLADVAKVKALR